jgi:hypothetical protein
VPEFTIDPLASSPGRRPSGARLYHRGSVFAEPARCRMDRAHAWRLLAHAEALERDTREPGKHGGCLKRTGLDVLRALLRQFYSYRDGVCFPSYEEIARAAGCCVETVRKAIRRLEAAGIIQTMRRKVVTSFVSRVHRVRFDVAVQTSNSYTFAMPSGAPRASVPQQPAKKADTKFRHETSTQIQIRDEAELATAKARWIAALLGDSKGG